MDMWVLDVGNGDSIFVRFPNGRTMLVDAGARVRRRDAGASVLLPFLREQGVDRIDVLVGSHPHNDHIGGLISVVEGVPVGHYLDAATGDSSGVSRRLHDLIRERGIPYTAVAAGDSLVGLGVGALVLHPRSPPKPGEVPGAHDVNSLSVVVRLTHAGRSVLLTGDVEKDTDRDLIAWGQRLRADVLKVAHHGSRTSSSPTFLAAVNPSIVAVSCGIGNRYGHPSPEVIDRFNNLGLMVLRTDRAGALKIRFLSETIVTSTWLEH